MLLCLIVVDGDTNDTMSLVWREDPIEIQDAHLDLPQFELIDNHSKHCKQLYKTGTRSILVLTVTITLNTANNSTRQVQVVF